jgi:acetylornithine deacetylase
MSTYPDQCRLAIERRTLPGETTEQVMREIADACNRVKARDSRLDASVRLVGAQAPSDVATDAPVVRMLERALGEVGLPAPVEGLSAWTDAALLNEAGIPAICFGPGDIGLAHAAEEYVPIRDIEQAAAVLERVALEWMRG